jgi:hypothetical protein
MGKQRARRAKLASEPKASEPAQPPSGASWGIVDRFLKTKGSQVRPPLLR